mgnify:CR=1 FL=1
MHKDVCQYNTIDNQLFRSVLLNKFINNQQQGVEWEAAADSLLHPTNKIHDQGYHQEHQKDKEQDFGDTGKTGGYSTKSEQSGD